MIGLFLILNVAFSSAHVVNQRLQLSLDETYRSSSGYYHHGLEEKYFDQKLDHLNENNRDTWKQRYWHDHSNYKENGRAFLFVHGANTVSNIDYIDNTFIIPLAKNLEATRFYLEHRFYGNSKPKSDTSAENLVYLSSQQALGDIAYFIEKISQQHDFLKFAKWVMIGVSYGGTLATWARFQYPKLILSAVAINAPLLAKLDYGEYYENIVNSLDKCSPECVKRIARANRELENAIKNDETRKEVSKIFNLCNELTNDPDDVSSFFADLAGNFAHAVDFSGLRNMSPKNTYSGSELCEMLNNDTHILHAYAEIHKMTSKKLHPDQTCFDHSYKNEIEKLKNTNYNDNTKISRQWIYQTCTEFGFLQSSSKTSEIFGDRFPATFLAKRCQELFGPEFNIARIEENISNVNKKFNGLDINVTFAIFIYNVEDPWRTLFITKNKTGSYETFDTKMFRCAKKLTSAPHQIAGFGGIFGNIIKFVEVKLGCVFNDGDKCF